MAYLAPSILSADLLQLEDQIKTVTANGADYIHVDVMDGHFVPNITFGPAIVTAAKNATNLPIDVHLMISEPQNFINDFAAAGADIITVHQEACTHLDRVINQIKTTGSKAGISLNPATPVDLLLPILSEVDLVLIMSVNPGFGGQKFIRYTLNKMRQLRQIREEHNLDFLIEVDGGVSTQTASDILKAGADILVAGSAIFKQISIAQASLDLKKIILAEGSEA